MCKVFCITPPPHPHLKPHLQWVFRNRKEKLSLKVCHVILGTHPGTPHHLNQRQNSLICPAIPVDSCLHPAGACFPFGHTAILSGLLPLKQLRKQPTIFLKGGSANPWLHYSLLRFLALNSCLGLFVFCPDARVSVFKLSVLYQ